MPCQTNTCGDFRHIKTDLAEGTVLCLADEECALAQVLRLKVGTRVELSDGNGNIATCEIVEATRKSTSVRILNARQEKPNHVQIHLYIGKSKPAALEEAVESIAQLGAQTLHIYMSDKVKNKQSLKPERLAKIARDSVRISKSAFHFSAPESDSLCLKDLSDLISKTATPSAQPSQNLVLVCDESPLHDQSKAHPFFAETLQKALAAQAPHFEKSDTPFHLHCIIGPEAGFTSDERLILNESVVESKNFFRTVIFCVAWRTHPHSSKRSEICRSVARALSESLPKF